MSTQTQSLQTEFQAIAAELNNEFPQRREVVEVLLTAALTRQHAFVLGPPGTAKSLLVRRFVEHFPGASYFETLLSKNRPDAAVLGPYDLRALRDESRFVRKDAGFLTTCDFSFIDEVGKMSPTLGHDMLAALNERLKHEVDNGRSAHRIPLHSAIAASNELPAAESEDAAALWDRLHWRASVEYLRGDFDFRSMLTNDMGPVATTVPFAKLQYAVGEVADVKITETTLDTVLELREAIRKAGLSVSDRRWRDSMAGVKATAWLAGRDETLPEDVLVLQHALWDDVESIGKVRRIILGIVSPENEEILQIEDDITSLEKDLAARKGESRDKLTDFLVELSGKRKVIRTRTEALRARVSAPRSLTALDQADARINAVRAEGYKMIGLDAPTSD